MFTLVSQQYYFYILLSHKESSPSSMSLFSYQSSVYSRQSFESGPWLIKCLYVPRRYTKEPRNNAFQVCIWTGASVTALIMCVRLLTYTSVCVCVCARMVCEGAYLLTHAPTSVRMRACGCTPLPPHSCVFRCV